jgi:hypothetical protein
MCPTAPESRFAETEHWIDLPDGVRLHAILRVRLFLSPQNKKRGHINRETPAQALG